MIAEAGILLRGRTQRHAWRQREEGCAETEAEMGEMQPPAKDAASHQKLEGPQSILP